MSKSKSASAASASTPGDGDAPVRLDLWLWSVRIHRSRTLAADDAARGRVKVNGIEAKASRVLRVGDVVSIHQAGMPIPLVVDVRQLLRRRVSAPLAALALHEHEDSKQARAAHAERLRLAPEPAASREQGRPTKRDRRDMQANGERWQRWSASLKDDKHG